MKNADINLVKLPHFHERTDLQPLSEMHGLWLKHVLSHFDLSSETTINSWFFPDWFSYIPPHSPCEKLICSINCNVLTSISDPQSFIRYLLIFSLGKSIDDGIEENVLEWRSKGFGFQFQLCHQLGMLPGPLRLLDLLPSLLKWRSWNKLIIFRLCFFESQGSLEMPQASLCSFLV